MKERLCDWISSYQEATMGRDYDPSREVERAQIFKADPRLGNRLVLRLRSKDDRDEVVR